MIYDRESVCVRKMYTLYKLQFVYKYNCISVSLYNMSKNRAKNS